MTGITVADQKGAMKPKVLVTGAAGGPMGATGRTLTQLLLERGVPVRALVRKDDDRAAALRAAGAEVVIGDLLEAQDMRRAATGVDYIYFSFAVQDGLMEATTVAAMAASEAGVKGIVNNSQWCADLASLSPQSRRHALSEAIFDAFPTPTVHLRGATYNMNMIRQLGPAAAQSGVLHVPGMAATDLLPLVAAPDIAAIADAVLQDFDSYSNKVILLVSQLRSLGEVAADFSAALGKEVKFKTIDIEAWKQTASKWMGTNLTLVAHLTALWEIMAEGCHNEELMTELKCAQPSLKQILGREPMTFGEEVLSFYQG